MEKKEELQNKLNIPYFLNDYFNENEKGEIFSIKDSEQLNDFEFNENNENDKKPFENKDINKYIRKHGKGETIVYQKIINVDLFSFFIPDKNGKCAFEKLHKEKQNYVKEQCPEGYSFYEKRELTKLMNKITQGKVISKKKNRL